MIEPELETKRLQILKEILPAARRFGVLNDDTIVSPKRLKAREDGARALGIELQSVDVRAPADFGAAFETFRAGGAEAVDIPESSMTVNFRDQLGALGATYKLPMMCGLPDMAAGCLASYGTSTRTSCSARSPTSPTKCSKGPRLPTRRLGNRPGSSW